MNFKERFRRLKDRLGLTNDQLAEIFGTTPHVMDRWIRGEQIPQHEFRATLLRFEAENMPALSPHLRIETLEAFRRGREKAVVGL